MPKVNTDVHKRVNTGIQSTVHVAPKQVTPEGTQEVKPSNLKEGQACYRAVHRAFNCVLPSGIKVNATNGFYITDDTEVIEYLKPFVGRELAIVEG